MSTQDEAAEGFRLVNDSILMQRIGMAIVRDTFLTWAEREAQFKAQVECWDAEAGGEA